MVSRETRALRIGAGATDSSVESLVTGRENVIAALYCGSGESLLQSPLDNLNKSIHYAIAGEKAHDGVWLN